MGKGAIYDLISVAFTGLWLGTSRQVGAREMVALVERLQGFSFFPSREMDVCAGFEWLYSDKRNVDINKTILTSYYVLMCACGGEMHPVTIIFFKHLLATATHALIHSPNS